MSKQLPPPANEDVAGDTFLRLPQIIGDAKRGIPAIVPLPRSTFLKMVKDGRAPKPIRVNPRVSLWRLSMLKEWMDNLPEHGFIPNQSDDSEAA